MGAIAPRRLGYIRTSTKEQTPAPQIDGLRAQCDRLYIEEGVSACSKSRPIYEGLLEDLQPGDTLVVWDVDRAYRSVIDALTQVRLLDERGIGFEAITETYDIATPEGGFTFTLRAALSEWEREKLRTRTIEGLEAARKRGVKLGRPRKLSDADIVKAKRLLVEETTTLKKLAKRFKVSPRTLSRALGACS